MQSFSNVKIVYLDQCDRKKCSGHQLIKLRLAKQISPKQIGNSLVLSPFTQVALSPSDREIYKKDGLVGIDGSWKQIKGDEQYFFKGHPRALPFLVAANTVNFGKPTKLNTAEAILSALWILGYKEEAEKIGSKLKYGKTFIDLNYDRLEAYANCSTSQEVVAVQLKFMDELYGS